MAVRMPCNQRTHTAAVALRATHTLPSPLLHGLALPAISSCAFLPSLPFLSSMPYTCLLYACVLPAGRVCLPLYAFIPVTCILCF